MRASRPTTSQREGTEPAALLLGETGTIDDCTARAESLFGYPREHMVARPVSEILPDLARFSLIERDETNARLRLLSQLDVHFKARRSDGSVFLCRLSLSLVGPEHARRLRLTVIPITAPFAPDTDYPGGPPLSS